MTLEEAKKILEKEGYFLTKASSNFKFPELPVWEKQEVVEAKNVANDKGFALGMKENVWFDRQKRLKKEYEKNTKAPGPGEEQPKEGNPALKESASQFNDTLLDEQAKKIKRLGKEIARLNGIIHDKNAILSDVAEELRLTKIREKNLAELGMKYVVENEDLKEKLADKGGNGIDWKRNAYAIQLYVNRASHERLWNSINQDICNEKELSFIINHGGKRVKYALHFDGTDIVYECSDPDKKPSFFRDDSVGAVTNLKDCSPAKDTHPAVDIAEEGGDYSDIIVLCGKDFIDAIKKMK